MLQYVWPNTSHPLREVAPYQRHRPEETLLYRLIERYYPEFKSQLEESGAYLPRFVQNEFDNYLKPRNRSWTRKRCARY